MEITIKTNVGELVTKLEAAAEKQIPFATAIALTRLAQNAQGEVRAGLPHLFNIRRKDFMNKGIVIVSANKKDWPHPSSQVATRHEFMARQELGGTKAGRNGRMLAMPVVKASQRNQVDTPKNWPGALLKKSGKRKYFIQRIKTGPRAGKLAVMRRDTTDRYPLQVIYLLRSKIEIKARWNFRDTVNAVVQRQYSKEFGKAFSYAIATGKK